MSDTLSAYTKDKTKLNATQSTYALLCFMRCYRAFIFIKMTPEEKARDLANRMYYVHGKIDSDMAKKCALIAVDEILNSNPTWFIDQMQSTHKFWETVRDALNAL